MCFALRRAFVPNSVTDRGLLVSTSIVSHTAERQSRYLDTTTRVDTNTRCSCFTLLPSLLTDAAITRSRVFFVKREVLAQWIL